MGLRRPILDVTGFLWRFQWFRYACVLAQGYPPLVRLVGLYTPFWWAARVGMAAEGHLDLAVRAGEFERHYDRLARVARL